MKKMSKKQFWFRFSAYFVLGLVLPLIFLIWRFKLFGKVSKISIGGWGFIAILLFVIFFIKMLKAIKKGLPFNLTTHIINAVVKVTLPLFLALMTVHLMKDFMTECFQVLCVFLVCETISAIANPLPQWIHENQLEEKENQLKGIFSSLMEKKGEEK